MKVRLRVLVTMVLAIVAATGAAPRSQSRAPRAIVLIVVDQMRADYIERFGHQWTHGLHRVLREGAWFHQAAYPFFNTVTCAGHATIRTGALPNAHGMISNEWWDRTAGRQVTCTEDDTATPISYGRPARNGQSAARLLVPTLGDELRAQLTPAAHVVALSVKARSAITLAGRHPEAVAWFDSGAWATSSAFASAPVPYLASFIERNPVDADFDTVWDRLLPRNAYLFEDRATGARPDTTQTPVFPHVLRGPSDHPDTAFYNAWQDSPLADAYLARMAASVLTTLTAKPDNGLILLGLGFSALDRVGHRFGPRSHEVQDVLARLDVTLGDLLTTLDRLIGQDNYVVALTSDHGVSPIPERARQDGLQGGRIPAEAVTARLEQAIGERLGPGPHVARVVGTDVYLAPGVYDRLKDDARAIRRLVEATESLDGVARVYTSEELTSERFGSDEIKRAAARSYYPGRSGDLKVVPKPYWIMSEDATTHGTAYAYDTHVPLVLMGRGIAKGDYFTQASPADIAPTLAFLSGITLSTANGRVLTEAFASSAVQ